MDQKYRLKAKINFKDSSTDIEFVEYSIKKLAKLNIYPKIIINIRPTTPFRDYRVIDKAITYFKKNYKNYSSLRSVEEMSETSYKNLIIKIKFKPIIKNFTMDKIDTKTEFQKNIFGKWLHRYLQN